MTVLMRELLPSSVKMLILGKVTVIADTEAKDLGWCENCQRGFSSLGKLRKGSCNYQVIKGVCKVCVEDTFGWLQTYFCIQAFLQAALLP